MTIMLNFQTAAQDGVKLWDLRRLKNFRTFAPYDENTPTQSGNLLCHYQQQQMVLVDRDMLNLITLC